MLRLNRLALVAFAAAATVTTTASAQSIASRVGRVRDGTVRFSYAARPDVCGNGRNTITTRGDINNNRSNKRYNEWMDECEPGPVRVAIDIADGRVLEVRSYVGGRWRNAGDATDLGTVTPQEAVDYLLGTVARGGGKAGGNAIFPATIAENVTVWPQLLRIARDDSFERNTRTQAVFWVGQAAGEKAAEGLRDIADDRKGDREVRLSAVFAISQHRDGGVPLLIDIAKTSDDREIKKQAIFWLGQSKDKRALDYFEAILTKR